MSFGTFINSPFYIVAPTAKVIPEIYILIRIFECVILKCIFLFICLIMALLKFLELYDIFKQI